MNNISDIHDCYGCGVCATACICKIIKVGLNADGFYEPFITDKSQCTGCGICREVCSYLYDELSLKEFFIKSYAVWSKDYAVRRKCSSGGVSFEIGQTLLNQGYKVCGVRYNTKLARAEHYIATTTKELIQSVGSKYIQSYTMDGFMAINRKEKYLITGTPCQIDSFRRYIQKYHCEENFVLLDFFCHGVPSMLVWQKYIKELEQKVGKITYASWRNKYMGWHDFWTIGIDEVEYGEKINWNDSFNMLIMGRKSFLNSRFSQGDMFYSLFLSDSCLGKQCYEHCKYKYDHSSADIRIGDLWGKTYNDNEDGVSGVVTFTKKGDEVLKQCNCIFIEHPLEVVAEGQMKTSPIKGNLYKKLMPVLKNKDYSIEDVIMVLKRYGKNQKNIDRVVHPLRSIKNVIKKTFR